MRKIFAHPLKRALALSVALVMSLTPALAARTVESKLTCGQTAHEHTDACYQPEIVKQLTCTGEGHTHDDSCYAMEWTLTCTESDTPVEGGHTHDDSCYSTETYQVCGQEEHTHDSGCYTEELTCGQEESAGHSHGSGCYSEEDGSLICGEAESEGHTHGSSCYTQILSCGQSEHSHSDSCNQETRTLTCGQSEATAPHTHGDGCYTETKTLICGQEESHVHTEDCYTDAPTGKMILVCATEEHVHTADCYSTQTDDWSLAEELKNALNDDNDVTLILNGATLNYNEDTGETSIRVGKDTVLTIADGDIAGGTIDGSGEEGTRIITVVGGGKVNLTGDVTLTNGNANGFNQNGNYVNGGGGVYVGKGSEFNMSNGAISGNHSDANGGGVLVEGGKFNMEGGTISNNTTNHDGGGVAIGGYLNNAEKAGDAEFNMSGGTISGNEATSDQWANSGTYSEEPESQGGGVYVDVGAGFNLSGGTISGNKAGEGGGIFVEHDHKYGDTTVKDPGNLNMTGGTVDGNTATLGEGGGIYIQGTGEISGGRVTNNVTYTTKDLGGGGIYIESDGSLKLTNAIITSNTANGLGGGLAACVHGKTIVYAKDGAAIYGNASLGLGHTAGHDINGKNNADLIDGYTMWAPNEIFKEFAQDVFTAGDATKSNSQGTAGIVLGNDMLGGGDAN